MNWISDGLSMDETKVSALILAFFLTLAFAFYQIVTMGDIANNVLMLLAYEIGAFTGIKIVENITAKRTDVVEDMPKLP